MNQSNIELLRSRLLKLGSAKPNYEPESVLYVMSRDQRVYDNHALLAAQAHALKEKLPLQVLFLLYPSTGNRAREHYEFMLGGLNEVGAKLKALNISFSQIMVGQSNVASLKHVLSEIKPAAVYFDFSPLSGSRNFQSKIAELNFAPVYVVDTHNIIPVWQLSPKQEVGAYTMRPKVHKVIADWLMEPGEVVKHPYGQASLKMADQKAIKSVLGNLPSNGTNLTWQSGELAANAALQDFIENRLNDYAYDRNDAIADGQSNLSPYLHFGQLSSLRVALTLVELLGKNNLELSIFSSPKLPQAEDKDRLLAGADALLEEMIVRKELSDNFCYYNENYKTLKGAPNWAILSLDQHRNDPREHIYNYEQFEQAATHDKLWNAAQQELTITGKMHGYMRMYWAKKVLEWSESPERAIEILVKLNDFYSIDGGDPNGYVGILWSVAGLHDRPWFERPVYGKMRYMNQTGAKKRFDIDKYVEKFAAL